jgi:hypothetical protein
MTLTTRLSVFFLTALGLALAGFSVTLYLLARAYLYEQADEQLDAVLNTLSAVAEIGPEGVEWKAHEHRLSLRSGSGEGAIPWMVRDHQGQWVDGSPEPFSREFLAESAAALGPDDETSLVVFWQGQPWHLARRRLLTPSPSPRAPAGSGDQTPWDEDIKYPALVITAGISLHRCARCSATLPGR